jgi:hypothetical protein
LFNLSNGEDYNCQGNFVKSFATIIEEPKGGLPMPTLKNLVLIGG